MQVRKTKISGGECKLASNLVGFSQRIWGGRPSVESYQDLGGKPEKRETFGVGSASQMPQALPQENPFLFLVPCEGICVKQIHNGTSG